MTLRDALLTSGWEAFENSQHEAWNITDLLNEFPAGESAWLDAECVMTQEVIIDNEGDELRRING